MIKDLIKSKAVLQYQITDRSKSNFFGIIHSSNNSKVFYGVPPLVYGHDTGHLDRQQRGDRLQILLQSLHFSPRHLVSIS
jgi:hypothetical protein